MTEGEDRFCLLLRSMDDGTACCHHPSHLMLKPQISALYCYNIISTKRRKLCCSSLFLKLAFSTPVLNLKESCGSGVLCLFSFLWVYAGGCRRASIFLHRLTPCHCALRANSWVLQTSTRRKTLTSSSGDCILTWIKWAWFLRNKILLSSSPTFCLAFRTMDCNAQDPIRFHQSWVFSPAEKGSDLIKQCSAING